jgi:pseudouridine-5'-phosphate glycosidase
LDHLVIDPAVKAALDKGAPVVALESTIITHGMPFPQNLEMARNVEAVVRRNDALPATIAIIDGRLRVGLSDTELEQLARAGGTAAKASRRDVAALVAGKGTAGTTVATTMQLAALAGIRVFATGGIGGVHRGVEASFDISADLDELSRTPVAVVCAGAKSILDLPKTLEVLETKGVPVLGYRTDEFPAFWSRNSGLKLQQRYDSATDIAAVIDTQFALGMGGVLVANPIPEANAIATAEMQGWVDAALKDAAREGIAGNRATPYLLKRIFELTNGRSLVANIALVEHNAAVASDIAEALSRRR